MNGRWLVMLALVAGPAWAAQPTSKFYVGLDVGRSTLEATQSQQFFGPQVSRQHGSDTGFKAFAGMQVSRYFAVEVGYTDFGSFDATNIPYNCALNSPPPCTFEVSASTRGPSANVIGLWPFADRWSLTVRGGAQYAQVATTERDPDIAGSTLRRHDSSWGFLYGVGLSYKVTPRLRVRLNWEQNDQISLGLGLGGGAAVYDLGSSSLASLGLDYRF